MISFVGSAGAAASSVALPANNPGDLIIVWATRSSTGDPETIPSLPTGWNNLGSGTATNIASRYGYLITAIGEADTGTWTNATHIVAVVYRGVFAIGNTNSINQGTSSTDIVYPSLTLQNQDGTSWVVALAGHKSSSSTPPTGMTFRVNDGDGTPQTSIHDTAGVTSAWAGDTVAQNGSSDYQAAAIELKIFPHPLIGKTTYGTTDQNLSSDRIRGYRFESPITGLTDTFYLYVEEAGNTNNFKFAIYDDSAGSPSTLLGESSQTSVTSGDPEHWISAPISVQVVAGQYYWLSFRTDDTLGWHYIRSEAGLPNQGFVDDSSAAYPTFDNPTGAVTFVNTAGTLFVHVNEKPSRTLYVGG